MSETPAGYDAFISYRRSDGTRAARRLRQLLKSYRLPKSVKNSRTGRLRVFLDTVYERGASDFYERTIYPALKASRYLLIVATPDAVRRAKGEDWIAREIADFSASDNAGNIIVVRALGDFDGRLPADVGERYPNIQIIDMRDVSRLSRFLPQRAARLADEKLKIVAPLFDVPLENMPLLRAEEERQQMRRLGGLAGGGTAIVAAVAGLSLYALHSQWQGQQALTQSFRVTQDAIYGVVAQYAESEPLRSPSRELVLQNCDMANRLGALSGEATLPETNLACRLEENLAIALANTADVKPDLFRREIDAARQIYDREPLGKTRLLKIVRNGYSTWLSFQQYIDPGRTGEVWTAVAEFEGGLAKRMQKDASPGILSTGVTDMLEAYKRTAAANYSLAIEQSDAGNASRAAELFQSTRKDIRDAWEALASVGGNPPYTDAVFAQWKDLTRMYQGASLGLARADGADRAAVRETLEDALSRYDMPSAEPARRQYLLAERASLLSSYYQLDSNSSQDGKADLLLRCLDASRDALAEIEVTSGSGEASGAAQDVVDLAQAAQRQCFDDAAKWIDRRRAAVDHQISSAAAAGSLRELIDDVVRIDTYRESRASWDDLYVSVALEQLSRLQFDAAMIDVADTTRIEALRRMVPYLQSFDLPDLTAERAGIARAAWGRLRKAHHDWLDALRAEARTAADADAVPLLRKLLAADSAWDNVISQEQGEFDRVYQADVLTQMADVLGRMGDVAGQQAAKRQAYEKLRQYAGTFSLQGDDGARAIRVWQALADWHQAQRIFSETVAKQ